VRGPSELEAGRAAYARRAWRDAYEALARAGEVERLAAGDVELLAVSAYMLGRDDESVAALESAHRRYLEAGETLAAVRCAFWIGMNLAFAGETGPAGGWLGRAQRLLDRDGRECAERGYLLLPVALQQDAAGDWQAAADTAGRAAEIGERFGDEDLFALATHARGQLLATHGRVEEGLGLLDEAMVAATSGARLPIVTGVVYCGAILACVETYDVRRAREWTDVLSRWCREQPQLVAFTGRCLIHRAEILQLRGDWPLALAEARRAGERLVHGFNRPATAQAFYRQGELHRLRGDLAAAERAYRAARRYGLEPQPGLALLRLAEGRSEAAAVAIRRVLGETTAPPARAALLPAAVEIMLATGELESAREAGAELERLAAAYGSTLLAATAAHATGALLLAKADAAGALARLRQAAERWQELDAPYEGARTRVLLALALRELGDEDTAALELEAAHEALTELGAAPGGDHVGVLLGSPGFEGSHGLTAREVEVLRLVAAGRSNRDVAATLVISEHTVARHLQNIFRKLRVSSRTAASAFAHEHDLV
jgi:ATP/maltotriose-dependent transcriptional regulator MalT